jgi:hypothetical protein
METVELISHHDVILGLMFSILLGIGLSIIIVVIICLIFPINPRK